MSVRNTTRPTAPEPADPPARSALIWRAITLAAVLSAVVGLATLAWVISLGLSNARIAPELIWIPMALLPLAFILLIVIILGSAARRRRA